MCVKDYLKVFIDGKELYGLFTRDCGRHVGHVSSFEPPSSGVAETCPAHPVM